MPFPNGFHVGGNSGINTNFDPAAAPGPAPQPHANAQRSNAFWSRVQSGMANESSGRNAHNLASTIGAIGSSVFSIGPSFNNFFRAVDSVYGQHQAQHHPHQHAHVAPPATHTNPAYAPMFSGHDIGARMAPIFASFEHGIRAGLEHIFANMDSELITQKLRTFQLEQQAYLRNDMKGPRPVVPDCVPAHLREFVALLDPSDESFGHAMLEMVKKDGEFQQQQSNRTNQLIGNAPQPRPGHHRPGHDGNEVFVDHQNESDPLTAEQQEEILHDLDDDASSSHRPPPATSSPTYPRPVRYQRPQMSNPEDEQGGMPPSPPGTSNRR